MIDSIPCSAIVAYANNRIIGRDGSIPWKLPSDLKFFKEKTLGNVVLMGRKTFESLKRPLPGRINIVLTSRPEQYEHLYPEVIFVKNIDQIKKEILDSHPKRKEMKSSLEIFFIGGTEIYKIALSGFVEKFYITEITSDAAGDSYFPSMDFGIWRIKNITGEMQDKDSYMLDDKEKKPLTYFILEFNRS